MGCPTKRMLKINRQCFGQTQTKNKISLKTTLLKDTQRILSDLRTKIQNKWRGVFRKN